MCLSVFLLYYFANFVANFWDALLFLSFVANINSVLLHIHEREHWHWLFFSLSVFALNNLCANVSAFNSISIRISHLGLWDVQIWRRKPPTNLLKTDMDQLTNSFHFIFLCYDYDTMVCWNISFLCLRSTISR